MPQYIAKDDRNITILTMTTVVEFLLTPKTPRFLELSYHILRHTADKYDDSDSDARCQMLTMTAITMNNYG